mgnify:FL=1
MVDYKKTRVLITGGAGFIGSHLCDYFISKNIKEIICLDNLSTGKKQNIIHLIGKENFKFINGDIRDLSVCQSVCKNIDYVFHQAALGSVPRSLEDPYLTNDVNSTGFLNMLIASRDNNVSRFIFAASSSTYGDSKSLPKIEEKIGSPLSPYALTKYINELYAKIFFENYGLEYIGLRYFNVFGERQDSTSTYAAVIPNFASKFMNNESPIINGDGSFSRDFTYVDNVIEMNILAMLSSDPNSINQIYNTACGDRTSILELATIIKKQLSLIDINIKNIPILFTKTRKGDIPHSLASIEKAKKLLNYSPKYRIENGLKKCLNWYKDNL